MVKVLNRSEDTIKKYNEILNVLFINMYGEATRDGGIYIKNFNEDGVASRISYKVAQSVSGLYGVYIFIDCPFWDYIRFLFKKRILFKKRNVRRMKKYKKGHTDTEWLYDITHARGESDLIWFDIYDFITKD